MINRSLFGSNIFNLNQRHNSLIGETKENPKKNSEYVKVYWENNDKI